MSLLSLQFVFDRFSDELGAPVRPAQRVDALQQRLRQANRRADDPKRRTPHALGTNRHRFFGQGLHYFRYRLLTDNRYRFYITAIGYGDKAMSYEERQAYAAGAQDAYDRRPRDARFSTKPWLQGAYNAGYAHERGDRDECPY